MVTKEEIKTDAVCDYELVVIIKPDVGDDALEPVVEGISQLITGKGGTVAEIGRWGKKKLAYPIKRAMEGSYVLFRMKLPPESSRELEGNLNISEDVLRHLLVKVGE